MDKEVKKHKNIARFVAVLGVLPGAWFLIATKTQLGYRLQIGCGYWIIALVILAAVWIMYAILTKMLLKDIGIAHEHAHSLTEQRHYKMAHISTIFEALFSSAIMGLSIIGFLVTDLQCYISQL